MNNEKEEVPLNKGEEVGIINQIMFNLLKASMSLMQLMVDELKKSKEQNSNSKLE